MRKREYKEFCLFLYRSIIVRKTRGDANTPKVLDFEGKREVKRVFSMLLAVYHKILSIEPNAELKVVRRVIHTYLNNIRHAKTNPNARQANTHTTGYQRTFTRNPSRDAGE